ncbi:MAG TPA: competence/damage-inducible protein A [Bacteroidales bacterium]|nr:competence/damage-inducible protein A [Bacteroidales bacterium]
MLAEIITIGDEILIGQIVDTNSAWMGQHLNAVGIKVNRIISISDNKEEIVKALDESFERASLILVTGGLGPTKDDITKHTVAEYFNTPLKLNSKVLAHVERILGAKNVPMNELNVRQAELPENCQVIHNACGTAAGMWFEKNGKVLVAMPGVPFEMTMMMENEIIPRVKSFFHTPAIVHKTVLVHGISESALALLISSWENALPSYMKLAYLPSPGIIRLRISALGKDKRDLEEEVEAQLTALEPLLGEKLFFNDDAKVENIIGNLMLNSGKTLAVAESCTGGNIAHLLTLMPGSSGYFQGGVVAYSNEIKRSILDVSETSLNTHGAVSKEVVEEMAGNVARKFGTDYGIGVSGIAGPDGGSADKPVGTVWIAVYNGKETVSARFSYGDNRERNITRASVSALNMLRMQVLRDVKPV